MIIGFFGTQEDRSYIKRLQEMTGANGLKAMFAQVDFFAAFAGKVKTHDLDAAIITCPHLLGLVIRSIPEFKDTYMKNGQPRKLTLDDYAGSFFQIPGAKLGREKPLDVLILNPLSHLMRVPHARHVFQRYIHKITKPEIWTPQPRFTWELATEESLPGLYERFSHCTLIGTDIETDEDSPHRTISCVCYTGLWKDGTVHTIVLPMRQFSFVLWMRKFNALPIPKVMQGGSYDCAYFLRYGCPPSHYFFDTLHMFYCVYAELPKRLDFIAGYCMRYSRFWKNDGKTGNLMDHYEYNARDGWATVLSCLELARIMPDYAVANYLIEFPLLFPCLHIELDGMKVNMERHAAERKRNEGLRDAALAKLQAWIPDYNPRSPDQTKRLLQVLGMGQVDSSDEASINAAASLHPLNEVVLSQVLLYRGYAKLVSGYFNPDDIWNGRMHGRFDPAGTVSGRLAASASSFWCGINLQTMPARDENPGVKNYIECDEGWDGLFENDNSQSEAYCISHMSGCQSMIDLLLSPNDYHSWNASAFFGVEYSKIYRNGTATEKGKTLDKPLRDLSKRTNHGANYNMGGHVMLETMGPKKVAEAKRILKLPARLTLVQVCEYLLRRYEETYPEIKGDFYDHIKRTIAFTHKLVSPLGWTRYFFGDPSSNKLALNAAVAHGPQNFSVGIINQAFYDIWHSSVYGPLRCTHDFRGRVRLKAQIHDSLFGAYRGADTPHQVRQVMQQKITVKDIKGVTRVMEIPVDVSAGKRFWNELK